MKKYALVMLALAPLSPCAFAVDGQTLINQSTVIATGGFPYRITQPGSYKLSGNLVAPANQQAILFAANNVTLDLNGFSVTCSFGSGLPSATVITNCVGESGVFLSGVTQVSIRNGVVAMSANSPNNVLNAVGFSFSTSLIAEDLHILINNPGSGNVHGLGGGTNSLIRHNVITITGISLLSSAITLGFGLAPVGSCIIEGNVGPAILPASSLQFCILVNNVSL